MKLKELIFFVEDDPEGGYTAHAVGESIFTEGETIDELKTNIKDALRCHFDEDEKPVYVRLHIVREEIFSYG